MRAEFSFDLPGAQHAVRAGSRPFALCPVGRAASATQLRTLLTRNPHTGSPAPQCRISGVMDRYGAPGVAPDKPLRALYELAFTHDS